MGFNIFSFLIVAVMCIMGIGSCVCIVGYMMIILAQKIYRKVRYGISLYN